MDRVCLWDARSNWETSGEKKLFSINDVCFRFSQRGEEVMNPFHFFFFFLFLRCFFQVFPLASNQKTLEAQLRQSRDEWGRSLPPFTPPSTYTPSLVSLLPFFLSLCLSLLLLPSLLFFPLFSLFSSVCAAYLDKRDAKRRREGSDVGDKGRGEHRVSNDCHARIFELRNALSPPRVFISEAIHQTLCKIELQLTLLSLRQNSPFLRVRFLHLAIQLRQTI